MNYKAWVIFAVFPGHPPKPIARLYNRSDAEDHMRFLQRWMAQGSFYVVFESGEEPLETIDNSVKAEGLPADRLGSVPKL